MPSVYLISDTHFSHNNICRFTRPDGSPLRPWDDANEMDEALIENWNSTVKPGDKVYHLGDVAIPRRGIKILEKLNGDKVLIKGNHDIYKLNDYLPYFRDIRSCHVMNGCFLSHVPIHTESLGRFGCNIHGHTHSRRVMKTLDSGETVIDPLYYNVCVECTNYRPILFEEVLKNIKQQEGSSGFRDHVWD